MADHAAHIKKHDPQADDAVIAKMLSTYRLVLSKPDSALVSFSDPEEVGRVRESFLRTKLGVSGSDDELDAAIAEVGEQMRGDHRNDRLVVYYLLAKRFDRLSVFA